MDDKKTAWERLQLIHTKGRPTIKDYIPQIFTDWYEMHGDRLFGAFYRLLLGEHSLFDEGFQKCFVLRPRRRCRAGEGEQNRKKSFRAFHKNPLPNNNICKVVYVCA